MDSRIYITFGTPMDPFGNRVDFQGRSRDRKDREIDIRRYVCRNDVIVDDPQRDREYTRVLADSVLGEFSRCNRVQSTNVVAHAFYQLLRQHYSEGDVYRVLRIAHEHEGFPRPTLLQSVEQTLTSVRRLAKEDRIRLAPELHHGDANSVLIHALTVFGEYHRQAPIQAVGDRVRTDHPQLVYYYQNRLDGYALSESE